MEIKIAKKINESKLVLNKGSKDGIQIGQRFLVYSLSEDDVKDPDTGESLGNLEMVKGTGTVTHVQEKLAMIESDRKSKAFKRIIRKPAFTFYFGAEEEIVDPAQTIPFENALEGDLAKLI